MEEAEDEKGYKVDGFPSYYHSGLTPPMKHVVRRRFLSRFVEERERKPFPPPKSEVAKAEKEIQDLIAKFAADKGKGKQTKSKKATSSSGKEKVIEEVEEEIVDYEEWMGDGGRVFDIDDANMHPECWLTKDEIKEIEDAIKKEKQEREERAEQDAKKAAEEAAIEEAAARAAEQKKKKKKDKKKKKKHEEEEVREMDEGKREISAIDEVALTINQGDPLDDLDDDVDLGLGDMFNFDDDDGDFLTL